MKRRAGFGPAVALLALLPIAAFAPGCQKTLPIPPIRSTLEGWSQPYQGLAGLRIHAFRTGGLRSIEGAVFAGGSWTSTLEMGAWAYVIQHPTAGLVVYDAGLASRARTEPEHYVGWLGAKLGMLDVPEGGGLAEQMRAAGLEPNNVTRVVISHLHFDHTGAVRDFPNAVVSIGAAEKDWVMGGVSKMDFVDLDPLANVASWHAIDFNAGKPLATLISAYDLVGDGSLLAVDLSGHTPGSTGLVVKTAEAPFLLTGDAAWIDASWKRPAMPISASNMTLWWEQIWRIRKFAMLEPKLVVVPGHDDAAIAKIATASFLMHDPPGGQQNARAAESL